MQQLPLTDDELLRYDRQIALRGFDIDKQILLKNSRALIIGLGGLGCSASQYLVSAGLGHITLVDFDTISKSNLHRQILYSDADLNLPKVEQAKLALTRLNPHVSIQSIHQKLNEDALTALINKHDIILDCSDNLATREQLNLCCFRYKKPLVSAAAIRMEGCLTVFNYQNNQPCYHCLSHLMGQEQLSCVESGVMAPLVGIIGAMQALEAIKMVTQYGHLLTSRLLIIDCFTMQFNQITIPKLATCPVCNPSHS